VVKKLGFAWRPIRAEMKFPQIKRSLPPVGFSLRPMWRCTMARVIVPIMRSPHKPTSKLRVGCLGRLVVYFVLVGITLLMLLAVFAVGLLSQRKI